MERRILVECKVRAHPIVVGGVIRQQMAEVPFPQHHDMVGVTPKFPAREALQKPAAIDRGIILPGWICAYGLGGMKQLTLAVAGFERYAKTTRRAVFLAEMERVVPLCLPIMPSEHSTDGDRRAK